MTWRTDAACKGMDPAAFYDAPPATALGVCSGCPVRAECRAASRGEYGVWGGEQTRKESRYRNGGRNIYGRAS